MKLREQGWLKLDDHAGAYVSGLSPEIAAATLAQLLSHTAGVVRDGPTRDYWQDRKPVPRRGRAARRAGAPGRN